MRRALLSSPIGLWLVAAAMALRLIVAPGTMPVAGAHGITVTMCGSGAQVTLDLPRDPAKPAPVPGECAFAALATAAVAPPDAIIPATVRLVPPLPVLPPRAARPHLGSAAPPPPATGPPSLT